MVLGRWEHNLFPKDRLWGTADDLQFFTQLCPGEMTLVPQPRSHEREGGRHMCRGPAEGEEHRARRDGRLRGGGGVGHGESKKKRTHVRDEETKGSGGDNAL